MKRCISLFMAVLFVLISAACAKQETVNDPPATAQDAGGGNNSAEQAEGDEPETEDKRIPGPEKQDLGGYNLRIAS